VQEIDIGRSLGQVSIQVVGQLISTTPKDCMKIHYTA